MMISFCIIAVIVCIWGWLIKRYTSFSVRYYPHSLSNCKYEVYRMGMYKSSFKTEEGAWAWIDDELASEAAFFKSKKWVRLKRRKE